MHSLENFVSIILVVVFLVIVPTGLTIRESGSSLEMYAEEAVQNVMSEIRADGVLTEVHLSALSELLYTCGYNGDFIITGYYYESGIDGTTHQYSVTYEEIYAELVESGEYEFKDGMYISIYVPPVTKTNLLAQLLRSRKSIEFSVRVG